MFLRIIATLAVSLFFLTGCASFPKNEVPEVTSLPNMSRYANKPSAFFDVRLYHGTPDSPNPVEMVQAKQKVQSIVESAVKESKLFSEYTFDEFKQDRMDHTIRVKIYNHGNTGAAAAGGFISGLTFGIIPAAATDNYTLVMESLDKRGSVIHTTTNKDAMTTWIGIWFIPAMGNTPEKGLEKTLKNQVLDGLNKLVKEKAFKYSMNEPSVWRDPIAYLSLISSGADL
jgi:hypothetical protein